jgi:hypothetical protein
MAVADQLQRRVRQVRGRRDGNVPVGPVAASDRPIQTALAILTAGG